MTDQRPPGTYPDESRERAVRMVVEATPAHGSQWEAICSVADKLGPPSETVRKWVRRAEIDGGSTPSSLPDRGRDVSVADRYFVERGSTVLGGTPQGTAGHRAIEAYGA